MSAVRCFAAAAFVGAALALSLLRPLPAPPHDPPCVLSSQVPSQGNPEGYEYTRGVWSLDGRITGYAYFEDSTIYTTARCANRN